LKHSVYIVDIISLIFLCQPWSIHAVVDTAHLSQLCREIGLAHALIFMIFVITTSDIAAAANELSCSCHYGGHHRVNSCAEVN